jgi:benzoyl-CoA reductase subunit C
MDRGLADRLKLFYEIGAHPDEYARQWKETHQKKIIGYFCSYAPEEIILAADALPFRIFNSGEKITKADAHLQTYCCSLVRGALDDALSGKFDFLTGAVFPHTCDSIQRLSDIWRLNAMFDVHLDVVLPVVLDTEQARSYMIAVLKKFNKELGDALEIEISTERLVFAAQTYNQIRSLFQKLQDKRNHSLKQLSAENFHWILKASMIMDRFELVTALTDLVGYLEAKEVAGPIEGRRVILAGGFCHMPGIHQTIEDLGATVIAEDVCTGSRYFQGSIKLAGDVLEAIAERYLKRINCPAKHAGLYSRAEYIVCQVKENQADGVIFVYQKFCDPHAFDYPYIKKMLDEKGIPSLLIEIENQIPSEGQFKTRVEAFIEMLGP